MGFGSPKYVFTVALVFIIFTTMVSGQSSSSSSPCAYSSGNKQYGTFVSLPRLNCYLHWTYDAITGTADIAFRATDVTASPSGNWVVWVLNPSASGMMGAQALVAHTNSNGQMRAYTSSVQTFALNQSPLTFDVSGLSAESSGSQIIIYATLKLPNNKTTINHVWQVGTLSDGVPAGHPMDSAHLGSTGTSDFTTGIASVGPGSGGSRLRKRNVHGVLNVVSWGLLMPIGALIARYLKVFKSAGPGWFYLHVSCQCIAFIVGVAGWATGMKLGSDSKGMMYNAHRNIGITLFTLATLQVFALRLRPNKDHKYRVYWNLYHWGVGYSVIILSIINVFKGLDILDPGKKWKMAYTIAISVLGGIALLLEASTWAIVLRRKKGVVEDKSSNDNAAGSQSSVSTFSGLEFVTLKPILVA